MIAVFTACIGDDTDRLRDPAIVEPGVGYFCFTDRPRTTRVWRAIGITSRPSPVLVARSVKIQLGAWPETAFCSAYLWLDAAFTLDVAPSSILAEVPGDADVAVLDHPDRNSIREEAAAIVARGLVSEGLLNSQLAAYERAGYPDDRLHATGLMVRRRRPAVEAFEAVWMLELLAHGHARDQMSFDYAAWRAGVRVAKLRGHYRENPYARWSSC